MWAGCDCAADATARPRVCTIAVERAQPVGRGLMPPRVRLTGWPARAADRTMIRDIGVHLQKRRALSLADSRRPARQRVVAPIEPLSVRFEVVDAHGVRVASPYDT